MVGALDFRSEDQWFNSGPWHGVIFFEKNPYSTLSLFSRCVWSICEPLCGSRKYPYSPHGRLLEIPRGKGVIKAKLLEEKYVAKLVFSCGVRRCKIRNPCAGSMNIFWNYTFHVWFQEICILLPPPPWKVIGNPQGEGVFKAKLLKFPEECGAQTNKTFCGGIMNIFWKNTLEACQNAWGYSGTPPYSHLVNMASSLLQPLYFVPVKCQ